MKVLVAALALASVAAGCGQGGGPAAEPAEDLPAGRSFLSVWVSDGTEPRGMVPGTRIRIAFEEDGRLVAHAGCNYHGGDARLAAGRLVITDVATTQIGCDEERHAQDVWLADFLTARPTWKLDGNELTLKGKQDSIGFLDERVANPDRRLIGERWIADTIIDGDVASSIPSGVEVHLTLKPGGLLEGNAGCRDFDGHYRTDAATITFTVLPLSAPTCRDEATSVEKAVLAVLRDTVKYRLEGDVLTVTHPSGDRLRFRAD